MDIITASITILLLLFVVFSLLFFASALFFCIFFYIIPTLLFGAFFAPSKMETVEKMLALSDIKLGEKAVDLGSGDGRLVIAFAKAGVEAHGYEINPFLIRWSRRKIKEAGLGDRAFIHGGNFWKEDFSSFDVVTVFGIGYMMKKLENKLKKELKPGSRMVSNCFVFPSLSYIKKEGNIYLYKN